MRRTIAILSILVMIAVSGCNLSTDNDIENISTPATATTAPTATFDARTQLAPTQIEQPTALPIPGQATNAPRPGITLQPTQAAPPPQLQPVTADESAYQLNAADGLSGRGFDLLNVQINFYAQNPANTNRYAVIDQAGMLYISGSGSADAFRVEQGPFTQFPAQTRETNNAATDLAVWSPDGQYVAFIVNGDQQAADGLWYFAPGTFAPLQLIVDCPAFGFIGCNIVRPVDSIMLWESQEVYWSPDSSTLLLNVNLPTENRRGLLIKPITRDERTRDTRPPAILYDYGMWSADGRVLASGRNPEGAFVVDWLTREGTFIERIYDAGANGLWMGWAVERPDGQIVTLGRPQNMDGPVAIYDENGDPLTAPIGVAFPERVTWRPDGSAVLIEAAGRQYVAEINGQITDISDDTDLRAVNWVR